SAAIEDVKERVRFCNECGNLTEEEVCSICRDARRDHTMICVVEQPVDLISVERTSEFRGLYHVLGGALSPLDGVEPEHLRIDELLGRLVDVLEPKRLHLGADGDLRRKREELLAVAARQIRHGPHDALPPEQLVRERRDVAHVDACADDLPSLADRSQRDRHERADWSEDDRRVELFGRRLVRISRPLHAERTRERLALLVPWTREREDAPPLVASDLRDDVSRG